MGNYVIAGVGNYVIVNPSNLGNYVIADNILGSSRHDLAGHIEAVFETRFTDQLGSYMF